MQVQTSTSPKGQGEKRASIWSNFSIRNQASAYYINSSDDTTASESETKPKSDIFEPRAEPGGVRVGRDFQAKIPPILTNKNKYIQCEPERALLIWSPCPNDNLTEEQINDYIHTAKHKYHYSNEQALGLLYWHRYDSEKALVDLTNFAPLPEEWTSDDKKMFDQAFLFHGKSFQDIRSMLPDKSISNLIRYYYNWKKNRNKPSLLENEWNKKGSKYSKYFEGSVSVEKEITTHNNKSTIMPLSIIPNQKYPLPSSSKNSLTITSQTDYSSHHSIYDDEDITKTKSPSVGSNCLNCGVLCTVLHSNENLCKTCFLFWKVSGEHRPLTGPLKKVDRQILGIQKPITSSPSGIYINHDDLVLLASEDPQTDNKTLNALKKEVLNSKSLMQSQKQKIDLLKNKIGKSLKMGPKLNKEKVVVEHKSRKILKPRKKKTSKSNNNNQQDSKKWMDRERMLTV